MTFLYYLPNKGAGVNRDDFVAAGLGYAWADATPVVKREITGGPDGASGQLVAFGAEASDVNYFPDRQTWRKVPDREVWVGMTKAEGGKGKGEPNPQSPIPNPQSLARRKQLDGHTVTLLDGEKWLVPIARGWIEQDGDIRWQKRLPVISVLDDQGQWVPGEVVSQYASLWELATQFDAVKTAATQATVTAAGEDLDDEEPVAVELEFDVHDGAIAALAANYRIGPVEASMLGLLTFELAVEVLDALIDEPTWSEWVKKNVATADAGLNTDAGPPASTPGTGRP